ncbi:Zn-dependent protease (includes SpoIVFB) [Desulfuromusa kysingii]|uniref:Zn-dependent protease (Includes SpoIVFB) n=1 Tax=Desulfuromusa kysingii TaxID=37625 RepID=A0A1H4CHR0_9BACT|nr:site-2 protease family protein [Desulfuromusa kysingii]SEA59859.1 Zn-dependent protease (includes SpoIVFB) [Desulfuromusa kysingii]
MNPSQPDPENDPLHITEATIFPPPPKKSLFRKFGPIGLLLFYLLSKLKYLGIILQIGKFKTFITMLISIWAYAMFWGWPFAVGFVALLFIHEMGHVVALRMMGIKATAPMFIPFMGAVIGMKQMPDNAFAEAVMAYGGPFLGTLGAIVCAGIGWLTGNPFWYALAMSGFLLNLFNLLPISPLDGGRIIGVISPKLWIVGLLGALALFYYTWSPIVGLIIIMGSLQIYSSSKKSAAEKSRYYTVTPGKRIGMGLAFLALLAVTSVGMLTMHIPLDNLQKYGTVAPEKLENNQSIIRIR